MAQSYIAQAKISRGRSNGLVEEAVEDSDIDDTEREMGTAG